VVNNALVVASDIRKKVVNSEYRGGNSGGGGGGGKSYRMFAPSNPQTVNQYVREYNYNRPEDTQQPKYDYSLALQQYHQDVERK